MWKEVPLASFQIPSWHSPRGEWSNLLKTSVWMVSALARFELCTSRTLVKRITAAAKLFLYSLEPNMRTDILNSCVWNISLWYSSGMKHISVFCWPQVIYIYQNQIQLWTLPASALFQTEHVTFGLSSLDRGFVSLSVFSFQSSLIILFVVTNFPRGG
jgi:hypothetical protein